MAKSKKLSKNVKSAVLGCAFVMVISVTSVLGVSAYLSAESKNKGNYFSPFTFTNIDIYEENGTDYIFNDGVIVKKGANDGEIANKVATIKNPIVGNVKPVYIRVAVVPVVRGTQLINLTQKYTYTVEFEPGDNWVKCDDDGYYYYTIPVDPGEETTDLFGGNSITIKNGSTVVTSLDQEIQYVNVDVIADAVQAVELDNTPIEALGESWSTMYSTEPAKAAWGNGIPTLSTSKP